MQLMGIVNHSRLSIIMIYQLRSFFQLLDDWIEIPNILGEISILLNFSFYLFILFLNFNFDHNQSKSNLMYKHFDEGAKFSIAQHLNWFGQSLSFLFAKLSKLQFFPSPAVGLSCHPTCHVAFFFV